MISRGDDAMAELYDPFVGDEKNEAKLKKAWRINHERDQIDIQAGLAPPGSADFASYLRCAIEAIACGLRTNDESCIYEGLAMVQDVELRFRNDGK